MEDNKINVTPLINFIIKDYGLSYTKKLTTTCFNLWCLNLIKNSTQKNEAIDSESCEITEFLYYLSNCIEEIE